MSDVDAYPILRTKGLKLKKIDVLDGHIVIVLSAPTSSNFMDDIVITVQAEMARVMLEYAVIDRETHTVRKYLGRTGDPTRDDYVIEGWMG